MQALHEAISALSLQLFNVSFKWSTAEVCKCSLNLTHHSHSIKMEADNILCLLLTVQFRCFEGAE